MKNTFKALPIGIAALVLVLGVSFATYSAVTQVAGLAVAQSAPGQWVNVKDAAQGNGLTGGILATGVYTQNSSGTFDIIRTQADNITNPTAGKLPVQPCVYNSAVPTFTSGAIGPHTCTTNGDMMTGQGSGSTGITTRPPWRNTPLQGNTLNNTTNTSAANTTLTVTKAGVVNTRWTLNGASVFVSAAATCNLTVQDGATTILTMPLNALAANTLTAVPIPASGISATTGSNLVVAVGACGAAVTSTVNVQASQQ